MYKTPASRHCTPRNIHPRDSQQNTMKTTVSPRQNRRGAFLAAAIAFLLLPGVIPRADAGEIFNTDFSKGTFAELGWVPDGNWSIVTLGADKPDLAKNPGPVAKFPANGGASGTLTKKFTAITRPGNLKLTFDAGYGWGAANHSQALQVMLLDADGNGYIFSVHRASATWGAQWGIVTKYAVPGTLSWAPAEIDTTQTAVMDGGGLRTFTITRSNGAKWTFSGEGWKGDPLTFMDNKYKTFTQVVLRGTSNDDDILFNKIRLEADPAK